MVGKGKDCPYPIDYEGAYPDIDIALRVAERCGGSIHNLYVDKHLEHLKQGKWVYNTCVKLSAPEVVFCKPVVSASVDGGEDIIGHTQYSPDQDRLYAYVWAKDENEAEQVMLQLRQRRLRKMP